MSYSTLSHVTDGLKQVLNEKESERKLNYISLKNKFLGIHLFWLAILSTDRCYNYMACFGTISIDNGGFNFLF